MGEVINLRSFRKSKERDERTRKAAENRTRSGRSKGERKRDEVETEATVAFLDGRRLDRESDEEAS
ncbi:MAG: DUF4169 family protein [Alphaproteobacteria bacterium]